MSNNSTTTLIADAIEFDWDKLQILPDDCYLIALDTRQISILESLLRFAEARHLWRWSETATWDDDVQPAIQSLKGCLLMGCNINDLIIALNEIRDAILNQNPALDGESTSNDVLDQIATSVGVFSAWDAIKAGLVILFPESAIPISIGVSVIEFLVNNANSSEAEVFEIAKMLGSTSGTLPD